MRPEPWYLGIAFAAAGLALSVLLIKDTAAHVHAESVETRARRAAEAPSLARSFARGTWRDLHLSGVSQAGFVNNLNDGLAWGIFPLFFASRGLSLDRIAVLAAVYPLVWGALQLVTGWASDVWGRKHLVVSGMVLQAASLCAIGLGDAFATWLVALCMLGVGTAMVYPVLLASTGDAVSPGERATALGVYRFWRDGGGIAGALLAGGVADVFGFNIAIQAVAALTAGSGVVAAFSMRSHRIPLEVAA
jgi:MFS family permease